MVFFVTLLFRFYFLHLEFEFVKYVENLQSEGDCKFKLSLLYKSHSQQDLKIATLILGEMHSLQQLICIFKTTYNRKNPEFIWISNNQT